MNDDFYDAIAEHEKEQWDAVEENWAGGLVGSVQSIHKAQQVLQAAQQLYQHNR